MQRRAMRWLAAALAFLSGFAILLAPRVARAANTARLVFLRGPDTDACPDETALRDAVAARLGYDPFTPWALDTLFAEIEKEGTGFRARIKLVSPDNVIRGARTLRTAACADLVPTLGLTISLAIDPMVGVRKGPPEGLPPTEKGVSVEPAVDEPPADTGGADVPSAPPTPPPPFPSPKLRLLASAGLLGSAGVSPSPTVGLLLGAGGRIGDLALHLEGRADLPASASGAGGRVSSFLLGGSVLPCAHTGAFLVCGRATLGALSAEGVDIREPGRDTVLWAEAGGRLGYEIGLGDRFSLRLQADAGVPFTRYALRISGQKVFEHPPVHGGIGVSFVAGLF